MTEQLSRHAPGALAAAVVACRAGGRETFTEAAGRDVLNHGNIEQIGAAVEVYKRPRTAFVAGSSASRT